ncbi:hypothetical protein ACJRO7_025125 [Eucalyptus globulus]|uniref:Uncharacterized protein n=1 Tax=Eucalyptus globulus TaxID=34317 RepID=A0ABD3KCG1_EUCGL
MAEREGATVKKGKEALKWIISLYEQHGLPDGLLPFQELIEVGFVERTGYMWVLQEKRIEHTFKMIGKLASYDAEMSGYLEKTRIRKLKGVKARELMIWTPCIEIFVDDPPIGKIQFKAIGGLTVAYPIKAFATRD